MGHKSLNWKVGIFLMLALFHTVIACNNNSGGGATAVAPTNPYPYNPACPNCGPIGQQGGAPILTNVKSATGSERVLFGIDILANGPMPVNMADPKAAVYYNGPVVVRGTMRITDAYESMFCYAQPGDYTIQTVEMVQMSSLTLAGGRLVAQGPGGQIAMRIYNAQFYNPSETVWSQSQNNRVGLNLYVESVNGRPCGSVSTY